MYDTFELSQFMKVDQFIVLEFRHLEQFRNLDFREYTENDIVLLHQVEDNTVTRFNKKQVRLSTFAKVEVEPQSQVQVEQGLGRGARDLWS